MLTTPTFRGQVEFAPGFSARPHLSHVLFDFDGTLSLIRQGWPEVMLPMFEEMLPSRTGETEVERRQLLYDDIMRLNGKQTIYQMIQFAARVQERGAQPKEPLWYKHEYLRRLEIRIRSRIEGLRTGAIPPDDLLVHGSRPLLEMLLKRGCALYLASGTDEPFVKKEAQFLDVARYFGPHIYGALDDYRNFSKKMVIERILRENKIPGAHLLAFGDGYVEIENTKEVGGLAVAVASDEANNGSGNMDEWKRQRLLGVGADVVIPDFRDTDILMQCLLGEISLNNTPTESLTPIYHNADDNIPSPGGEGQGEGDSQIPTLHDPHAQHAPHSTFDLSRLTVLPLARRKSLCRIEDVLKNPDSNPTPCPEPVENAILECAAKIEAARQRKASVILMYGAHLPRNGAALLLKRMIERGWLTHLSTNGAGSIHDWEFAFQGCSTESVKDNVALGTFGAWDETSRNIHLALLAGGLRAEGYGEALGRFISEDGTELPAMDVLENELKTEPSHPLAPARAELLSAMRVHKLSPGRHSVQHLWKHASILGEAYRLRTPLTVHPGIGYDIITNHPMFNGAAIGRAAGIDFCRFCSAVEKLDDGVVLSIGSAIMAPQVFEKSLSCVNNVRLREGRSIVRGHSFYVVDLQDGGNWDWAAGEPPKTNPAYYLRFCKSFSRMGGGMRYVCCDNVTFVHHLYHQLRRLCKIG